MESIISRVTARMASGTMAASNRQARLDVTTNGAAAHTIRNNEGTFLRAFILLSHSFSHSGGDVSCCGALFLIINFGILFSSRNLKSAALTSYKLLSEESVVKRLRARLYPLHGGRGAL